MRKRGQGALEYLMTYGWALLIIAIAGLVLWKLGVFKPVRKEQVLEPFKGFDIVGQYLSNIAGEVGIEVLNTKAKGMAVNITKVKLVSPWGTLIFSTEGGNFTPLVVPKDGRGYIKLSSPVFSQCSGGKVYVMDVYLYYRTQDPWGTWSLLEEEDKAKIAFLCRGTVTLGGGVGGGGGGGGGGPTFHKVDITITEQSGNDLTNYQVRLTIDNTTCPSLNWGNNGNDIRFYDPGSGTYLDYWIESWDDVNQNATIWVKVPSIPANGAVTIEMYYGDTSLPAASNLTNTQDSYTFTEDFSSGTINSAYWHTYSTGNGRIQANAGQGHPAPALTMDSTGGNALNVFSTENAIPKVSSITITYEAREWGDENHGCNPSWTQTDPYGAGHPNCEATAFSCDGTNWYRLRNLFLTGSWSSYTDTPDLATNCGGSGPWDVRISWSQFDNLAIATDGIGVDNIQISWTGFAMRVSPEPSVSFGAEQTVASYP